MGFIRPDGRVGIRNHVAVVANCGCGSGLVMRVAAQVPEAVPLIHADGCSSPGEYVRWKRIIKGVLSNPNLHSAVLLGVGCERYDAREIAAQVSAETGKEIAAYVSQDDGGGEAVIQKAAEKTRQLLRAAAECRRQPAPFSSLIFGTECGGSDALSGITANPAVGHVSDWVAAQGGTVLLSEVAEFFGTEEILAGRAVTPEVGERIRRMIYQEEREVRACMGANASRIIERGNMDGGLTTIQEKALGCIRKGGTSPITDVVEYAEPVGTGRGLVIMHGPGYDPASLTGLFACGAQVFFFTTGRGNPLGFPAAPCVKVCSNDGTFRKVGGARGGMDINAGLVVTGALSMEALKDQCLDMLKAVCSGRETASEQHRYGGIMCIFSPTRAF